MKKSLCLLLAVPLVLWSCSDNDGDGPEVAPSKPKKVASITSVEDTQEFSYDNDGRISEWSWCDDDMKYQAEYSYPSSGEIRIVAEENIGEGMYGDDVRRFDEIMHLDSDGRANFTEGSFTDMKGDIIYLRKKYRYDFCYDNSAQLTSIKMTEWVVNNHEEVGEPWTWENKLTWEDGKLVSYTDYNGNSEPYSISEYSYGQTVDGCRSLSPKPVVLSFYVPLQLAGVFGRVTEPLLAKESVTRYRFDKGSYERTYSYSFVTTESGTDISGFSIDYDSGSVVSYSVAYK